MSVSTVGPGSRIAVPSRLPAVPMRPSGTFGCLVRHNVTGELHLLSANHAIGNFGESATAHAVLHVGETEEGRGRDLLATLTQWTALTLSRDGYENLFEVALARLSSPQIATARLPNGVRPRPPAAAQLRPKAKLWKYGARTQRTEGVLVDTNFACEFHFMDSDARVYRAGFQRQLLCRSAEPASAFSDFGDSGSLVLDHDNAAVGIVVGRVGDETVISPIGPILARFDVSLA